MRLLHTIVVAMLCILAALVIFGYKYYVLDFPLTPNTKAESWHIEAKLEFEARGKPVKVFMYLPRSGKDFSIVDENFISDGYGFTTGKKDGNGNRVAKWSKRNARGKEVIFYRAILYEATRTAEEEQAPPPVIDEPVYGSAEFAQRSENEPIYLALSDLIRALREKSADEESFISELFKVLAGGKDDRLVRLEQDTVAKTPAALAALVLNHAAIPAKVVHGIQLNEDHRDAKIKEWTEVYVGGRWLQVDMDSGTLRVPYKLLPWWEGDERAYTLSGGVRPSFSVSVKSHEESALTEALWKGNQWTRAVYDLSVYSLPVNLQLVFNILLLVPVGALVAAFLRQMIGVVTFGTFMPVLVALAFRETQLLAGIFLFCGIVGLGLVFRSYFDKLHLLMFPRVTAILTIVVIIMFGITLVTFKMGITAGLSVSLFPMVIMTMVIERMSLSWDEFGPRTALKQGVGSLFVAAVCYLVMNEAHVKHLIVTFPELLFVVLALSLLLGRYNGYKLTEYYRFRALKKAIENGV